MFCGIMDKVGRDQLGPSRDQLGPISSKGAVDDGIAIKNKCASEMMVLIHFAYHTNIM